MSNLFGALTSAVEGAGWLAIPAAFVWGILSIVLSPWHLTTVPLVIGYINRGEATSTRRALWTAACFAGGVLITLAIAGGVALAAGRLMGQTGIWGNLVVAVVLLVFGLHLVGILKLPAGMASPKIHPRRDALGAFILGLVMGLALGPCTFAYLGPVLAVVFDKVVTMLHIKVLGAGCSNCERLYEVAQKAVASLDVEADVVKVTDFREMMKYGILQTPALVINEELITVGKVLSLSDMTTVLTTALAKSAE